MELRHIRYFLAIAEELNFTRAAEKVGIGQPPLSQQIRDLETEVGVQLFHRVPRGVELTPAGEAFMTEARLSLAAAERAKSAAQRAHRGEVGKLVVGFTTSAAYHPCIHSALELFHAHWPGVKLTLVELNTAELLVRLQQGEIDAAFVRPGPGEVDGIRLKRLEDERMMIVVPEAHALNARKALPLREIAAEPIILYPRSAGASLYDEVVTACQKAGFVPKLHYEVAQTTTVVTLVAANLGVSIVPASISRIRLEGVAYVDIAGDGPVARLALATSKATRSPVVSNFVGLVSPTTARTQ